MTDPRAATDFIDERPALLVAGRLWRELAPQLLPAVFVCYLLSAPTLALPRLAESQADWAGWLRSALFVGSGWLGQAYVGWLVLRHALGLPVGTRLALEAVIRRCGALLVIGLARVAIVYAPLFVIGAVRLRYGMPQPGQMGLLPAAVLLLVPFGACLGALLSTAATATMVGPRAARQILGDTWRAGDAVFPGLFPAAGALLALAVATSFLGGQEPVYLPNHFVGSLLWVLLPVYYLRALRRRDDDSLKRLGEALAKPSGGLT